MSKTFAIFVVSLFICHVFSENEQGISSPSSSFNQSEAFSSDLCDLVTEMGICLFNGQKVLTADAQPKGIIGHWSFDDAYVLTISLFFK